MIQTLEQRCTANIKLVGLAQQCTEQVRAEFDRKFDMLMKQQEEDRNSFERTMRQLTIQLTQQERKLGQYEPLQQRVAQSEAAITTINNELAVTKEQLSKVEDEKSQLQVLLSEEKEMRKLLEDRLVEVVNNNQHKILTIVDENHNQITRMYQGSINRFQDLFNAQQESLIDAQQSHRRFVDASIQNQSDNIEHIQQDFINRLNTHYNGLSQEMTLMKENIQEEINSSILQSIESSAELKNSIREVISQSVTSFRSELFSELEERVCSESQRVLDDYIFLAQNFGDNGDDSIVYPAAPTPSVAQTVLSPTGDELKAKTSSFRQPQRQASFLSRANSGYLQRSPSTGSVKGQDSPIRIKDTKQNERKEFDAIHNTLQALLEMHRQDILSIHHRLDAMQVPLGVAPVKPLSRRNSVVSGSKLKRGVSMQSVDSNISALTLKSAASKASSKGSKSSKGSLSSKASRSKIAEEVSIRSSSLLKDLENEDLSDDDNDDIQSKGSKKRRDSRLNLSDDMLEATADKEEVINPIDEDLYQQKSFKSKKSSMRGSVFGASSADVDQLKKTQSNHTKNNKRSGHEILNLSDDKDSDSDYEDIAEPVELSANMSFVTSKSKSFTSQGEPTSVTPKSKSLNLANLSRTSSYARPTQVSLQRHSTAATSMSGASSPIPCMSSNSSNKRIVRRKAPTIIKSMPVLRLSAEGTNSSIHSGSGSLGRTKQLWKVNNTYVSSSGVSPSSGRKKSAAKLDSVMSHRKKCDICHFHQGKNPTSSIKDTVVSVDGCCRYCGKDLHHLDHRNVDTIRVQIPFTSRPSSSATNATNVTSWK
jgi:hypothetical protein